MGPSKALVFAFAIAAGIGCARQREATPAPGPPGQQQPVVAQPAQPAPVARPANSFEIEPERFAASKPVPSGADAPGSEAEAKPEEEKEKEKPRDFSAELSSMLSDTSGCLQPRPRDDAGAIAIAVTVHVMPSGAVTRGEVDASGLQEPERACLRGRVESLRFALPIENAPFAVRTSLQVTPKVAAVITQSTPRIDSLGMIVTQAPVGGDVSPGVVPPADPGVVPPPDPGVVPPPDPGVPLQADPGVVPTPDPPAEVLGPH